MPAPAAAGDAKLKLEVLVYSDVASERMVFINGRKYLLGDTVAERARVEEIQPDGVVLSEQGRRFTLRH
jgi:type II secretory pathway component PulC